jgi:hypothetical protein
MENLDYWRLCDELSVIQSALLIVGVDPASFQDSIVSSSSNDRPNGYDAAIAALTHAILAKRLPATIRRLAWEKGWIEDDHESDETVERDQRGIFVIYKGTPDWGMTSVRLEDLRDWLRTRGVSSGFFFPEGNDTAAYLNSNNPTYAPKLAAAIGAWEAVSSDPLSTRGRTAKQAIAIWLRRNASRYGLTKEDGNPNEQGIEEVSKIANWETKGGAPKTPGE